MEQLELEYSKFLKENSIKESQLPTDIKKQISILKAHQGKYNKNPTETVRKALIKQDVCVADLIADFIEGGITEEEEKTAEFLSKREESMKDLHNYIESDETIDYRIASEQEFNKLIEKLKAKKETHLEKINEEKQANEKAKKEAGVVSNSTTNNTPIIKNNTTSISPEVAIMEAEIKEKLSANNNIISRDDLKSIINRPPADPYQQVGNTKLKKVFLRSEYKLV